MQAGLVRTTDPSIIFRDMVAVEEAAGPDGTLVYVVGGGAASGKSWLTKEMLARLVAKYGVNAVALLKLDYFLPGMALEPGDNWDGYLWERYAATLAAIRQGLGVIVPEIEWESGRILRELIFPVGLRIVLAEGVGTFRDDLDTHYDAGYWVDCPHGERLRRGIARSYATPRDADNPDAGNYGAEHEEYWPTWIEKDRRYQVAHDVPNGRGIVRLVFDNSHKVAAQDLVPQ
jgi:hypothetical protein